MYFPVETPFLDVKNFYTAFKAKFPMFNLLWSHNRGTQNRSNTPFCELQRTTEQIAFKNGVILDHESDQPTFPCNSFRKTQS